MKKIIVTAIVVFLFPLSLSYGGWFDDIMKGFGMTAIQGVDDDTVIAGLKEALSTGTRNAVKEVSRLDGYLADETIKILMPEKIQKVAEILTKVGYQRQVDDFITSMNRAAEKAAPKATAYFVDSIKEMTFDDARNILNGGDTAATDYFKVKTSDNLYNEFKPVVSTSMNEIGVTSRYKEMMEKYTSLPFVKEESMDLDHYVTNKALDGLFFKIAQEETKIRTDPAARVSDLLKKVFDRQ